jgi:hypothetical protein
MVSAADKPAVGSAVTTLLVRPGGAQAVLLPIRSDRRALLHYTPNGPG